MGIEIEILTDHQRFRPEKSEVERLWSDNTKAKQLLKWQPKYGGITGFRKGLEKTTELGVVDTEKLNVNGGAIALGHPVGSSGSRIILTTLKELERRGGKRALVSLCIGGGQGGAIILERE